MGFVFFLPLLLLPRAEPVPALAPLLLLPLLLPGGLRNQSGFLT